ncbi:hypothetical protein LLEC1_05067 [Akanthomyces lecanii]|uniref:Methyltransferase domain-containing protein n=1 Tax=Cordyceps confragosa TaxID=2714763 RepID=A0A179IEL9_CORDF|nr:hypothetical protein LLEC1_05067 [Akanthomyces lecanii]
MATATDNVAKLYGAIAISEGTRLAEHPMERELTLRTIRAHVPSAPAAIADIGGGPGKLAFALADDGHLVDLVDLTPELIAKAQAEQDSRPSRSCVIGPSPPAEHLGGQRPALGVVPAGGLVRRRAAARAAVPPPRGGRARRGRPERAAAGPARHGRGVLRFSTPRARLLLEIHKSAHLLMQAEDNTDQLDKQLRDGKYDAFKESLGLSVQGYHTCAADARAFLEKNFADEAELIELRSTEGILGGGLDAKLEDAGSHVVQAWVEHMYDQYSTKRRVPWLRRPSHCCTS